MNTALAIRSVARLIRTAITNSEALRRLIGDCSSTPGSSGSGAGKEVTGSLGLPAGLVWDVMRVHPLGVAGSVLDADWIICALKHTKGALSRTQPDKTLVARAVL